MFLTTNCLKTGKETFFKMGNKKSTGHDITPEEENPNAHLQLEYKFGSFCGEIYAVSYNTVICVLTYNNFDSHSYNERFEMIQFISNLQHPNKAVYLVQYLNGQENNCKTIAHCLYLNEAFLGSEIKPFYECEQCGEPRIIDPVNVDNIKHADITQDIMCPSVQ